MEYSKRTIGGLPIRIAVRLLGVYAYYISLNVILLFSTSETYLKGTISCLYSFFR